MVNGNYCIIFRSYGLFYKVVGSDALVISYIFNTRIKDYTCYVAKDKINDYLFKLDELNIDYYINGVIHNFIVNNYNKYLVYSNKKKDIDKLYNSLIKGIENE